jgi:hypothetical protein
VVKEKYVKGVGEAWKPAKWIQVFLFDGFRETPKTKSAMLFGAVLYTDISVAFMADAENADRRAGYDDRLSDIYRPIILFNICR